jgi:hypothetical protein
MTIKNKTKKVEKEVYSGNRILQVHVLCVWETLVVGRGEEESVQSLILSISSEEVSDIYVGYYMQCTE